MLNVFRHVYARIFIHNYPTSLFHHKKKKKLMGRMSMKKRGRAADLIENKASLRLIRNYHTF